MATSTTSGGYTDEVSRMASGPQCQEDRTWPRASPARRHRGSRGRAALWLSATAAAEVEHGGGTFVDPGFSAFLTESCGFPVTVTVTERDTFADVDNVSVQLVQITASVVGNDHLITLRTNSPLIVNDHNNINQGLIVQVRSADNQLLIQYAGQLRILDDGTEIFHPAFPEFDLCDFLTA
jgi:hypothetical protein